MPGSATINVSACEARLPAPLRRPRLRLAASLPVDVGFGEADVDASAVVVLEPRGRPGPRRPPVRRGDVADSPGRRGRDVVKGGGGGLQTPVLLDQGLQLAKPAGDLLVCLVKEVGHGRSLLLGNRDQRIQDAGVGTLTDTRLPAQQVT
jgi:hypothetical protein